MRVSCQGIINVKRPLQGIIDLKNAGLDKIFLPVYVDFSKTKEGEYFPETAIKDNEMVIEKCKENGIQIDFLQAPIVSLKADMDVVFQIFEFYAAQSLELCKRAKCNFLLLQQPIQFDKDTKKIMHDCLVNIAVRARKYGIMLLIKNQTRNVGGHLTRGFCADAADAVKWIDRLNEELGYDAFGFCIDIGICNICGNDIQAFIHVLENRVKLVILRENNGHNDVSMLPFTYAGTEMDWLGTIRGLRDISFDGELAVDFSGTYNLFSPLLRPTLYPLVKETAKYFKWQIGIENNLKAYKSFVLFGAGNMCRNYMKCYGEKYPPLFACDNNPEMWGTTFEGLEVKCPEILKNLPYDVCVVICNIYYREIEVQLREMGIKDIGYFNDEYMPLFDFDRLGNE